jgi:hypothetical protein
MAVHMLTTDDNPYDPFTQWDDWNAWDQAAGYHTTAYLARIVRTSHELPDAVQSQAIEDAIDEIMDLNISGKYKRVVEQKPEKADATTAA